MIEVLAEKDYWGRYNSLGNPLEGLSESEELKFRDEIYALSDKLDTELSQHWEDGHVDYAINDDWNPGYHHSMGIYSKRIHCKKFVGIVSGVLADGYRDWCFHVACEAQPKLPLGEFFFHKGKIYGLGSDELDYSLFEK